MLSGIRGYYIVSLCIVIAAILLFCFSFERKKPKTRETVVIAVMITLAVVGRLAFLMTPQFKPCAAIIIISGIALGREAGFLCGAISALVSNMALGQGPWTPWQMVAFGIIGLLAGIFFKGTEGMPNKIMVCIFGFISTFIIYGVIMDTAIVLIYTDTPSFMALIAAYSSGIIFNLIHAISTVIFLWILTTPLIKKLLRIKVKYGMYNRNI